MATETDKEIDKSKAKGAHSPAKLQGNFTIDLHTRNAVQLFNGRHARTPDVNSIPGLNLFSKKCKEIFVNIGKDKPYAIWWACQIENMLDEGRQELKELKNEITRKYNLGEGVTFELPESLAPTKLKVASVSPYPYQLAMILRECDKLYALTLSYAHIGFLDKTTAAIYNRKIGTTFRRITDKAAKYNDNLDCSFEDVEKKSEAYTKASDRMGIIPDSILSREWQPIFAPTPPTKAQKELLDEVEALELGRREKMSQQSNTKPVEKTDTAEPVS